MVNQEIRDAARKANVKLWQIASGFGVGDAQFSRWLRKEFSPERKEQALKIIEEIGKEAGA